MNYYDATHSVVCLKKHGIILQSVKMAIRRINLKAVEGQNLSLFEVRLQIPSAFKVLNIRNL